MRDCLNRFRTSQVSGLISSPNSPFMHPLESCVRGDKAYKGLSAFIRVQWQKWGEHGKVTFVRFRRTRVATSQRCVRCPAALASPCKEHSTLRTAAPHVTFDMSVIWLVCGIRTACIYYHF